jgi:hypothetical protein
VLDSVTNVVIAGLGVESSRIRGKEEGN